jgi:hypothetical protein
MSSVVHATGEERCIQSHYDKTVQFISYSEVSPLELRAVTGEVTWCGVPYSRTLDCEHNPF